MKITEADLRRIIEEELKTIANSKHPSDVEMIEDPNVGGILSDPFEHVPEDVPAVVDKPQARVQRREPLVRERRYSLCDILEEDIIPHDEDEFDDTKEINEARFVGGFGFGAPPSPTLSEVEELDERCGDHPEMPSPQGRHGEVMVDVDVEAEVGRDLDYDKGEGSMAHSQLRRATQHSQKLSHMIRDADDLPEWIEAKITKASDYLSSVYEYLDYELHGK